MLCFIEENSFFTGEWVNQKIYSRLWDGPVIPGFLFRFLGPQFRLMKLYQSGQGAILQTPFMSSQSKSCRNMVCYNLNNNDPIWQEFCTCHNSETVVTCTKFLPDWSIEIKVRGKFFFARCGLLKHLCDTVPGSEWNIKKLDKSANDYEFWFWSQNIQINELTTHYVEQVCYTPTELRHHDG